MSSLATPLRRQLESAIKQARTIAENGAHQALQALAVHEPDPYKHMNEAQRMLRRQLRAQAKQLGDGESHSKRGAYEIKHLAEKLAYDQWHRLLFARYLLENNLLISPEHSVSVTLDDCEELNAGIGLRDAWAVAANFAAKELPEIFRADDPVGAVEFSAEARKPLIDLVIGLPIEVFTAGDSLGWCYQYWQAERKIEVNDSGNKIAADELPAVTQLFTEDYMVDFLLDNTLGAWHAGKMLAATPSLARTAQNEAELRQRVALPDCPWTYLRFVKGEDGCWTPAANTFGSWPISAKELKCLDPCMGSGHFVVGMFDRLLALRMSEEHMDAMTAASAVIADNLFGLELDPRCTQIGAFNLALAAWRKVGHCPLPAMHIACSGFSPNTKMEDWLKLAGENDRLQRGMGRLYALFKDAPLLGSLINPRTAGGDLLEAEFHELQPLLEKALAREAKDDNAHEIAVTARGLAKAAEILAGQFTFVVTNVPYLGRGKQENVLKEYCARVYPDSKADLATCFVERCLEFCATGGSTGLVTPQNWLFLASYFDLRKKLLKQGQWDWIAALGPKAFQTPMWDFNVMLICISQLQPTVSQTILGFDVAELGTADEKANALLTRSLLSLKQSTQLTNPDSKVVIGSLILADPLGRHAVSYQGLKTGDDGRFRSAFWELSRMTPIWRFFQSTVSAVTAFAGRESILRYQDDGAEIARNQGQSAWGELGIAISQMASLPATLYLGDSFDSNVAPIIPRDVRLLPALWAFCSSKEFVQQVRQLDQKVAVANGTFAQVPFDLERWQKVAAEKYPHGLPKPFSSDPTQWLFNGHPAGADQPLHVAVARLLGYQWPRQTGSSFPDCPALVSDGLEQYADADGIVCLSATKGEAPAAERLRVLLAHALGSSDLRSLVAGAGLKGSKSTTLDEWLHNEFFEQHCALFQNRPFIWHIWDAHKSGFSALVNYHQLDHATLEKLTYAYLGDWIRRQQAAVDAGEAGSDARLAAAKLLQDRLKLILEGEPPYDIFVRWKSMSQQAIGWHPDINDGVRMNIRPFLASDIPGGKKSAGLLRAKPNIKWDKDRGREPYRDKSEFPWFWCEAEPGTNPKGGKDFIGSRWNDVHLTRANKEEARK